MNPAISGDAENVADSFKRAMRGVASTVYVLTTLHEGKRYGLTATSVCSLSMEPPSLLACVHRNSETHHAIVSSRRVCINALGEDQREIAARFSGVFGDKGEQRFAGAEWFSLVTGAPALRDATAVFDCEVSEVATGHTHSILTCVLKGLEVGSTTLPLLYANRQYAGLRHVSIC